MNMAIRCGYRSHLYAWKSVKWVRGFEFLDQDTPGFWNRTAITCAETVEEQDSGETDPI